VYQAAMMRIAACLAALAAAGVALPAERSAPPLRTSVYFIVDGGRAPVAVRRALPRRSPFARAALTVLLQGPTADERRRGVTSALPPSARIRSFRLAAGTATVDLAGMRFGTGTTVRQERSATQIARTLIGLSGIERVVLRAGGRPWPFVDHSGRVLDLPVDYRRMLGWTRVCPLLGEPSGCFSALP
jgi:spore germination protein GerM